MADNRYYSTYSPGFTLVLIIASGSAVIAATCFAFYSILLTICQLTGFNSNAPQSVLGISLISGIFFILITAISFIKRREVFPVISTHKFWMGYLVKICEWISKKIKRDSNKVVRSFISIHNDFVIKKLSNGDTPERILLLLPHCLQLDSCALKITSDIKLCKMCGKCVVAPLLKLSSEFGIDMYVSTGGTMARKVIKDRKPHAILAVACERDLLSGIKDTIKLPVIGVLNERPFGPCYNTTVDTGLIRKILAKIYKKDDE